jgi:hypothetical protein
MEAASFSETLVDPITALCFVTIQKISTWNLQRRENLKCRIRLLMTSFYMSRQISLHFLQNGQSTSCPILLHTKALMAFHAPFLKTEIITVLKTHRQASRRHFRCYESLKQRAVLEVWSFHGDDTPIQVFVVVTPFGLGVGYQRFGAPCCLRVNLRNVGFLQYSSAILQHVITDSVASYHACFGLCPVIVFPPWTVVLCTWELVMVQRPIRMR